jgi:hemerythrin-like domain-containing protein
MSTPAKPGKGAAINALDYLKADHEQIKGLLREFASLRGNDDEDERKAELVDEICSEMTLHAMVEEEIFYPMLRSAIDDDEMMDEADVEHAGARDLISQLEVMYPGDDHFDATVVVLGEEFAHHVAKEETDMFDAARKAGLALEDIAEQLAARREELEEDLTSPPSSIDAMAPRERARPGRN